MILWYSSHNYNGTIISIYNKLSYYIYKYVWYSAYIIVCQEREKEVKGSYKYKRKRKMWYIKMCVRI